VKYLVHTAFAALLGLSSYSYAATNGINYDPAHSPQFVEAQAIGNLVGMKSAIRQDLEQIKTMGFKVIKTFFSTFCTNKPECVTIAELAHAQEMQVLVGVHEFWAINNGDEPRGPGPCVTRKECESWTVAQVKAAIESAQKFPQTVIGIVVGNEDMFDFEGKAVPSLQRRIVADIGEIKTQLGNSVTVTSAQRDPDWYRLNQNDPNDVLSSVQVVGDNIYPFWGNSPEKIGGVSVAITIQSIAMKLKNALSAKGVTGVIVTEEGWPSCGMNPNTQDATISAEINYFHTWRKHENQSFDSYYFVAYDLKTAHGCPDGANTHFGLCTDTNETKDSMLCNCKGYCATPNGSG